MSMDGHVIGCIQVDIAVLERNGAGLDKLTHQATHLLVMRLVLGPCHHGLLGLASRLCRKVLVELSDLLLQSVKFVQEFRRYRIRLGRTLSALESIREGC